MCDDALQNARYTLLRLVSTGLDAFGPGVIKIGVTSIAAVIVPSTAGSATAEFAG